MLQKVCCSPTEEVISRDHPLCFFKLWYGEANCRRKSMRSQAVCIISCTQYWQLALPQYGQSMIAIDINLLLHWIFFESLSTTSSSSKKSCHRRLTRCNPWAGPAISKQEVSKRVETEDDENARKHKNKDTEEINWKRKSLRSSLGRDEEERRKRGCYGVADGGGVWILKGIARTCKYKIIWILKSRINRLMTRVWWARRPADCTDGGDGRAEQ